MITDYITLDTLNSSHHIDLVKNIHDNNIYVKKTLSVFSYDVYAYLVNKKISGIPYIKEIEKVDNRLVIIEEYINGTSLEDLLDQNYRFDYEEVINIACFLCDTLTSLNKEKAIVHRDIKPSNIIKKDNQYYLIDFNAAKFEDIHESRDTVLLGTEGYAAPEQYGFGASTIQTDIYCIGKLMEKLLETQSKKNPHLDKVIQKCTELDSRQRYFSFSELKQDLLKKNIESYIPVGYRTRTLWKIILATIYYFFAFLLSIFVNFNNMNNFFVFIGKFICFFAFFGIPQITFNYRNMHQKLGINKLTGLLRVLSILLLDAIYFFNIFFLFGIIAELFNHL